VAIAGIAVLASACDRSPPPTSIEALVNGTYLSEWTDEGVVTLAEGEYRAPSAPDAASEVVIFFERSLAGDLDGDGVEDAAAILVEQSVGTGTFYRLHALLSDGNEARDVSSRLLGDRITVEALRIEDGVIETDVLIRRPQEPEVAEPTIPLTLSFVLTNRGLLPLKPPPGMARRFGSPDDSTGVFSGMTWRFVEMRTGESAPVVADSLGDTPELVFSTELTDVEGWSGRAWGSTGCNHVLASYHASHDGGLRISGVATTRRACEPSLMAFEESFTVAIGSATAFEVQNDELEIRFAGGVMTLSRVREAAPDQP
jgi:hypothetical protein